MHTHYTHTYINKLTLHINITIWVIFSPVMGHIFMFTYILKNFFEC